MATWILAAYIALIFVRPMDWWAPVQGMRLVNMAAIATLFAAVPRLLSQHFVVWRLPQTKFALALVLGATLSWLYPFWGSGMLMAFQDIGRLIVLYFLIVFVARDSRRLNWLVWTILACVVWMAVHAILQAHTGQGFGGQEALTRRIGTEDQPRYIQQAVAFGIFNDPNDLCLAFVIAVPLLLAAYRMAQQPLVRWFTLALVPLVLYGAWLTNSRGGMVGLLGMLAAYALARMKGHRRWVFLTVGVLVLTVLAPSRFSRSSGVDTGRVNAWGSGIMSFQEHPLFGIGYDNFEDLAEGIQAHNSFIHVLAELGLAGYVPWFLLIALTLVHVRRAMQLKDQIPARDHHYLSALFSALVGFLTSSYFLSRAYNPVLYILLGLAIAQVMASTTRPELHQQVFGKLRLDLTRTLLCCLASIPFFWVTIRLANIAAGR